MIILFLLFFIISEDTQMWLGQIFDFFQKSEMGGSIKDHTCKKTLEQSFKSFSLKIDTLCFRILRKWNKSANNMTIVSVQLSYLRKHSFKLFEETFENSHLWVGETPQMQPIWLCVCLKTHSGEKLHKCSPCFLQLPRPFQLLEYQWEEGRFDKT